eukprot:SAG22_NODE_126_length_18820_cov_10.207788_15_plen_44_part_01
MQRARWTQTLPERRAGSSDDVTAGAPKPLPARTPAAAAAAALPR